MSNVHSKPRRLFGAIALAICAASIAACAGQEKAATGYVGAAACAGCHAEEFEQWQTSDHFQAMSIPSDSTVLGLFNDTEFSEEGIRTVFSRSDEGFQIITENSVQAPETLQVAYTFGFRPLQQYLVPGDRGRLQAFTVAWSTEQQEWFSLYPEDPPRPGEFVHWSGAGMNWNYMCAECHSTGLIKDYQVDSDSYETTFSEINVACEACHGPGEKHTDLAQAEQDKKLDSPIRRTDGYGLSVPLRKTGISRVEIDVCAQCHSRRTQVSSSYIPGDPFLDHYRPALLEEGLYYPDGQIQDEVYVYGSFLQSEMFRRGVRCSNCHNPHTGKLRLSGNALCSQCHLAETFDRFTHVRHKPETEAAQCVTCHMPERTYMGVDPRRDHSFKVPRPAVAERIGIPDVCSRCHEDRSVKTLISDIEQWFPNSKRSDPWSLADVVFAARNGDADSAIRLNDILRNTAVAPITRATAVSLLGRYPVEQSLGAISRELRSPDHLVRLGALTAADALGPMVSPALLLPLLRDQVALIRMEAARLLIRAGINPEDERAKGLKEALDEYIQSQHVNDDQAGSHVNLAVLDEQLGKYADARRGYEKALRLDSLFAPALINLGLLFNRIRSDATNSVQGDEVGRYREDAISLFRRAARQDGEWSGTASYYLGLLLAEDPSTLAEAATALERAAMLVGTDGRLFYNAGLAFQELGQSEKAETLLREAVALSPTDPDPVNALVILFMQQENWIQAHTENNRLGAMLPNDPGIAQRGAMIQERIESSGDSNRD